MLKERFQEILDFTKSESPYQKANKGWINQDIFLELGKSTNTRDQKTEFATVKLLWSPINKLISNIFIIILVASLLVLGTIALSKGRISLSLFNTSLQGNIVQVDREKIVLPTKNDALLEDKITSGVEEDLDKDEEVLSKTTSSSTDILIELKDNNRKEINNNEDLKVIKTSKSNSNFF